jgi:nucleoside-diphosphate-sugar epimerase
MNDMGLHLLTGATGYIGGRLLKRLERDGLAVRCLCRNPEALGWRVAPATELVRGDLLRRLWGRRFRVWIRRSI